MGREESVKGLIFGLANVREDYIDIDGYSNKKTLKGALSDLARAIEKYSKVEADGLRSCIKSNEISEIHYDSSCGFPQQYILEYEDVPCASTIVGDIDNDDFEVEYKDANWYLHTRIIL